MKPVINKKVVYTVALFLITTVSSFAQTTEKKQYTDDQVMKIMDKKSYPNYDKDKAALDKIKAIFWHPGNSYNYKTSIEKLNNMQWTKSKMDSVKQTYSEYWEVYTEQMKSEEDLNKTYNLLNNEINQFKDYIKNTSYSTGNPVFTVPKELDEALEQAKKEQDITNDERYKSLRSFAERKAYIKSDWFMVEDKIESADYQIALLKYQKGDNYEGLKSLVTKREETMSQINDLKKAINTKMMEASKAEFANVRVPAEVYTGADKATLRKNLTDNWAKSIDCKDYKLLKVVFNHPGWEHKKGTQYERNSQNRDEITGQDFNYSFLEVTVIFTRPDDDPEIANMFEAEISKDNINKTTEFGFICSDENSFKQVLVKNVK